MKKIIVVDDHPIFRAGLKQILDAEFDFQVVAEAGSSRELYKLLDSDLKWDGIVLDVSMPGESGIEIVKELAYRFEKCRVLMLSNHPESQFGVRALRAGASGYMTKEAVPRDLVGALRRILLGKRYIGQALAETLADGLDNNRDNPSHHLLSDREFQVLRLLGSGKSVSQISKELLLSIQTISTYRSRILQKMGMKNTSEITRYVVEKNL